MPPLLDKQEPTRTVADLHVIVETPKAQCTAPAFVPWGSRDSEDEEEENVPADIHTAISPGLEHKLRRAGIPSSEFELGAVIGRGSVGQVHKALHRPSQRTLALKSLPPAQVVRPDFTENTRTRNRTLGDMMNEVRIMSTVGQHPSVVAIVGVLMCGSDPAVAMECLGGGSLEDVIERKGSAVAAWRPPKAVSFSWCSQLCAALHFLHHRETPLVHRDIKPSNLVLGLIA
ncbi:kinase-like domain-containing protein [Baffinella frigidus]|nr:kinase-like domain-containing protein [Cryptophyta sp. CCMP2293]